MVKIKNKQLLRKTLILLLVSFIFLGIGFIIAILISYKFNYNMQDAMTFEGLIALFIGLLMSMKGGPLGYSMGGSAANNVNLILHLNNATTRQERKNSPNHKKNSEVEFTHFNLTFIIGGILIFVSSIIFF